MLPQPIQRIAKPRPALVLSIVFVLFSIVWFQFGVITEVAGKTGVMTLIDVTFNNTVSGLYEQLESYGESGRNAYLSALPIDYLYATLTMLTLTAVLTYFRERLFPNVSLLRNIFLLPLIFGVADYLENAGLYLLLSSYPEQLTGIAQATTLITTFKLALVNLSVVLFVIGLIGLGVQFFRSKRSKRS